MVSHDEHGNLYWDSLAVAGTKKKYTYIIPGKDGCVSLVNPPQPYSDGVCAVSLDQPHSVFQDVWLAMIPIQSHYSSVVHFDYKHQLGV